LCCIVGDILGIRVHRAWEFNSTFPLRSIIPIYLTSAIPLLLLKALSSLCGFAISSYSLTVAVRLVVTLFSLITDHTAMQLARWQGRDAGPAAVVMATSYVSLVYYTRTFSNTFESFLYAALLYVVTRRSQKQTSDFAGAVIISMLIVVGVFNRPTFVVFAMVPYLWWLFSDGVHRVIIKAMKSMLTAVPLSVALVICDSVYFGWLDINRLNVADLSDAASIVLNNLTMTPLNFILYNTQTGNLAQHGIHPHYTHFVVNIPLLFSVLSLWFFYNLYCWCFWAIGLVNRKLMDISVYRRQLILFTGCLVPVILLSLFPHQEPRFLIPLLPVFAAMYSHKMAASRVAIAFWVVANLLGSLFYGCVHQAGVVPCLGYLQQTPPTTGDRHIVFWHTYTAPQHLLLLPSPTQDPVDGRVSPPISLEGNSVEDLIHHLTLINGSQASRRREKPTVMVATSSSEHQCLVCMASEAGMRLELVESFWPHLSIEHPPWIHDILCRAPPRNCCNNDDDDDDDDEFCERSLMERIRFLTSLNLYRVNYIH